MFTAYDFFPLLPPLFLFSPLNKRLTLAQIGLASFLSHHIPQKETKWILSIRRLKADGVGRCFIFSGVKEVAWASLASLKIMEVGGNVLLLVKLQKRHLYLYTIIHFICSLTLSWWKNKDVFWVYVLVVNLLQFTPERTLLRFKINLGVTVNFISFLLLCFSLLSV